MTCTEILVRLRRPRSTYSSADPKQNHILRISAAVTIALGMMVMPPGEKMVGELLEILGRRHPRSDEMSATSACWETPWQVTPLCLHVKTMLKRLGESSTRC